MDMIVGRSTPLFKVPRRDAYGSDDRYQAARTDRAQSEFQGVSAESTLKVSIRPVADVRRFEDRSLALGTEE